MPPIAFAPGSTPSTMVIHAQGWTYWCSKHHEEETDWAYRQCFRCDADKPYDQNALCSGCQETR